MSKINFKCFGDNIFSLLSPVICKYTTLEFDKDSFIKQIKAGTVEYSDFQLRKECPINFQFDFFLVNLLMKAIKVIIPDDKETFKFEGHSILIEVVLKSFDDMVIATLIKDMLREMSDNFIKEAVASMDKNSKQPTFWDNIAETLYKNLILNMRLHLTDVTMRLTRGDDCFVLSFDDIAFSNETGVTQYKGAKVSLIRSVDKSSEYVFIDKCDFETHYNRDSHLMKLHIETMRFNINPNVFQGIADIIQERDDNKNKVKCFKRRRTLLHQKPPLTFDNKKDYKKLWAYAIRTVMQLRKYALMRWYTVFDLALSQYEDLSLEYYKDNSKKDNMLLMKKHLFLKYSRIKAEELILQNKKKPAANPLMNFFMKSSTDLSKSAPPSLSSDECSILDKVYARDSIKKFIKGSWSDPIFLFDKFVLFMTKLSFDIFISNFTLCFDNNHSSLSLNISQFYYDFIIDDRADWFESYNLRFNEIDNKDSLYQEKTKDFLIKVRSYDKTEVEFGFKHLIFNSELILFMQLFSSSTRSHSWSNVFTKQHREKAFSLSKYAFNAVPNISLKSNRNVHLMVIVHALRSSEPSEVVVDYEVKEKSAKRNIVARHKVVVSYMRARHRYVLKSSDFVCFVSVPIVSFLFELMPNENDNGVVYKPIKDIEMKNECDSNVGSFDFEFCDSTLQVETQLSKCQINFLENEAKPSLMFSNLFMTKRNNEMKINIDRSFISFNKQSLILFTLFYNHSMPPSNSSPNSSHKKDSNEIATSLQVQSITVEFQADASSLQLTTNSMTISNNPCQSTFNSKLTQMVFFSPSFQGAISLLTISTDFIVSYSSTANSLSCSTSDPNVHLDVIIIDQLLSFISSFQSQLKQEALRLPSASSSISPVPQPFKFEIKVMTPKMTFDRFRILLSRIEITNASNLQSLNITCLSFVMSNERMELIKENKLIVDVLFNQNNEMYCYISFNYLQIFFLQQDITNLMNSVDYESSMQNYQRITRLMGSNEWKDGGEYSDINLNSVHNLNSNSTSPSKMKKNLIIKVPKCNIDFSLNSKEKLLQLSSEGIGLDVILDQAGEMAFEFRITSLSSSFHQFNSNQFVIISQNTENALKPQSPSNQLLDFSELTPQSQLVVLLKDNLLDINLSSIKLFLRIDAFYTIYAYFINALPDHPLSSQVKDLNTSMKVRCLFINSSFVLQTSFDNKENLIFQMDQFYLLYQTLDAKLDYGQLFVQINSLRGEFVEGAKRRKLIYSKNDFLILKCNILPIDLDVSMVFDTIMINLSYKDIISFLKAYHIGLYYLNKEQRISLKQKEAEQRDRMDADIIDAVLGLNESKDKVKSTYRVSFEMEKIDITLIDNLQNSYYPFLNFNVSKLNIDIVPDQIDVSITPSVHSYNYISCEWEPSLEPVLIQLQYKKTSFSLARKKIVTCYVHQDILVNLSDMNISLTWGALSRWIERFLEEKKSYEESFESSKLMNIGSQILITDDIAYISKISNNNIRNISGNEFEVIYQGATFSCATGAKIDLEYLSEMESNGKSKEIALKYSNHLFKFPIEKMGVRMHRIDANCFFISEISLTKQLSIEVSIFSPVVFHNKSQYGITIVFNSKEDSYFMILPPKSKQGVPFSHLSSFFDIYFSNVVPGTSHQPLTVSEVLATPVDGDYHRNLYIETKSLVLKLVRVLQNVRKLVINAEHVIVNNLPCVLIVNCDKDNFVMKKSSVLELDFICKLTMLFAIQVGNEVFYSKVDNFFDKSDKVLYMSFSNNKGQVFYINAVLIEKETQKMLVLHCEYLIKNNTGLNLHISSKTRDNGSLCFQVDRDIYLISSNPDIKTSWFLLSPKIFQSNRILLKDLLSEATEYKVKMATKDNSNSLSITIQTSVSYLPKSTVSLSEMLCSIVFTIQPMCKITNLLENKWMFIASSHSKADYQRIPPLTAIPFHFFYKGEHSRVCFGIALTSEAFPSEWTDPLYINQYDLYTCCVFDNIFNVEIRPNHESNLTDVFITKSTANNSKILINNQTSLQIAVYQKDNDSRIQIILPNSKEQFNVYSLKNHILCFVISNKTIFISIPDIREPKTTHLSNDTLLYSESNGLKTYFTFFNIAQYNTLLPEAKQFNFDLNFSSVYVSLIGDNKCKDKKFGNYLRNEILLMELKNIQVQILQKTNQSLLNKLNSRVNVSLESVNVFNQISTYGKFAVVLSSIRPALRIGIDSDLYPFDKICKMNSLECAISKLSIGIDPNFVEEMIHFVNNVIYRMNIINFNVNELFIDEGSSSLEPLSNKNRLIESYQANSLLCSLNHFTVPQIDFSFELSKIGLKSLLRRQFNFSSFLSSILANLAGDTHSIKLKSGLIFTYLGTVDNLLSLILNRYRGLLFSECNKIGFKGVLLSIASVFKSKEIESDLVKINRKRLPRPFYGQYKSIKRYDETHAGIYEMMASAFGDFRSSYHFTDGVRTNTCVILFTTMSLFIFNLNSQIERMIDYFYIKSVAIVNCAVLIEFNQKIDNLLSQKISFANKETAEVIGRKLMQAVETSTDPIQLLN